MMDLNWVLHQTEGQFFERKSCYDRSASQDIKDLIRKGLCACPKKAGGFIKSWNL